MRNRALIILLILVVAAAAWLIYANWGKLKRKTGVSPLPLPATDNANGLIQGTGSFDVGSMVDTPQLPHGGWKVPDGIDGDKLQEDLKLFVGSIGDEVVMLQSVLNVAANYKNIPSIKLDGYFGANTVSLLKKITGESSTTLNSLYSEASNIVWGH